jgi:hypothetical protein
MKNLNKHSHSFIQTYTTKTHYTPKLQEMTGNAMSVDQMTVHKISENEMTGVKMPVDEMTAD